MTRATSFDSYYSFTLPYEPGTTIMTYITEERNETSQEFEPNLVPYDPRTMVYSIRVPKNARAHLYIG
jgi:hypothetical protein